MSWARITTVTLNTAIDRVLESPGFHVGAHAGARRIGGYPAGKGINVSRVLATLGTRSVATGFVGRDELGRFERFLERAGGGAVVMQLLVVRGRTRENITLMDPVEDTETHIREQGFQVAHEDVRRMIAKVGMLARPNSVVVFAGSTPPGVRLGDFRSMLHRCEDGGAAVVLDSGLAKLNLLDQERVWMLKVNHDELCSLTGMPADTEEQTIAAARSALRGAGGPAEYVLATRGAAGAVLLGPGVGVIGRVFVHPGRIAHTVGCGDSLLAGLLHARARGDGWQEAVRLGVAAATANAVSRKPGRINLEDVDEFANAAMMSAIEDES